MAHEILSVKLWELEDRLARLSSRIHLSEAADHPQLQQEIRALRRECAEAELTLEHRLRRSRAELAPLLADAYGEMARCARRKPCRCWCWRRPLARPRPCMCFWWDWCCWYPPGALPGCPAGPSRA